MNATIEIGVVQASIVEIKQEIAYVESLLDGIKDAPADFWTREKMENVDKVLDIRNYKYGMLAAWESLLAKV